ncbi:MAG: nuclear transport factor 2 family protein [Solirubrobacteraceae bacterium]
MRMFADLERMDAHAWASCLAPDVVMRFANEEPVYGREGCREALAPFLARIEGLRYDLVELWEHGEATIVEANVTYRRTDGREVTLPTVTIYRTGADDLISDYRVYADVAPVFAAPPEPAGAASAELTVS